MKRLISPKKPIHFVKKIFLLTLYAYYNLLSLAVRTPKRTAKPKFNVVICAIFKDEGPYLKEWITHHYNMGVSHFFMYNNNSADNYLSILKPYIDSGIVTLHDWKTDHSQIKAYEDCIDRHSKDCSWMGFIDLDEFIVSDGIRINDFLEKLEDRYGSVLLNWKCFGSSGIISRDLSKPVTEEFTSCDPDFMPVGKCFFNTRCNYDRSIQRGKGIHHNLWTTISNLRFPPVNASGYFSFSQLNLIDEEPFQIWINHYMLKSLDEYKARCMKTDVFFARNPHNMHYFNHYNATCTAQDSRLSPNPYLVEILPSFTI